VFARAIGSLLEAAAQRPSFPSFPSRQRTSVMTPKLIDAPDWHQATTLIERLALLRVCPTASVGETRESDRARLWRAQAPFTDASLFSKRLATDGLDDEDWTRLVAEPASVVYERAGAPPTFVPGFIAAYEQPADVSVDDLLPSPAQLHQRVEGAVGFLVAVEPLLKQARVRLRAGLRAIVEGAPAVPFDPAVAERLWLLDLPSELLTAMDRTFALELHVARVMGLLSGETPEQRFASFIERLRDPEVVLAIFREYPVLAKNLAVRVDQWVAYGLEFFRHLVADWAAIRATFSPSTDPGQLAFLSLGAGDPHREGRSVLMLRLSSGLELVYKPKALAVDVHFQELIGWLNTRGLEPQLRTLGVLNRGAYGWIELVKPTTCTSEDEVHRFYFRQGALVLLAYMVGATDFHFENVLAIGEHPVLIDLETLFTPHPRVTGVVELPEGASVQRSVLRAGLLPRWTNNGPGLEGVDLSGLGTKPGQRLTVGAPTWQGGGTDELHVSRVIKDLAPGRNRAELNGADIDVIDYVDDIVRGFSTAYRLVVEHREALLAPAGPIARFAHDEVRVLFRGTQHYAFLRYEASHPNVLRDALDRDRVLDKLWARAAQDPRLARLIPSERDDLCCGDIPMFFTTPSETTIRDSRGRSLEGMLDEPGYDQVVRLIRGFGEQDLDLQRWYLRTSLSTLETPTRRRRRRVRRTPDAIATPVDRQRLLEAARRLGDRVTRMALVDDDLVYLGLRSIDGNWRLGPVGSDLYQGTAGISLFLGYLGAVVRDERMTAIARATLRTALQDMDRAAASTNKGIGAFEGWGSLLYVSTHLGVLWDDGELLARACTIASRVEMLVSEDDQLDIIGGAAGTIVVLLGLQQVAPSEAVLRAAIACGDHLLRHAQPMECGIAWPCSKEVLAPLTGFAHGAGGMAWALGALARATGEARFAAGARQAIAYERSSFVPDRGWPDLRKHEGASSTRPSFEAAWCHGGPGIGLARLSLVEHEADEAARAEVLVALEMTRQELLAPDHSLCHGDLGNIELFVEAARVLDEPRLRAEVDHRAALLLESLHHDGPICGLPLDAEVPGLMTGISGIGYGLLRLAEPEHVPCVLLLSPPPSRLT
jgi:type 2 lantibiotic biosynthesis protein LanM